MKNDSDSFKRWSGGGGERRRREVSKTENFSDGGVEMGLEFTTKDFPNWEFTLSLPENSQFCSERGIATRELKVIVSHIRKLY
jgi:hypothetical protein